MEDYTKSYYKKVHFWGRFTITLGIIFCLSYGLYLSFIMGYHPGWDKIITGFLGIFAIVGHTWFNIADTMTYVLLMGPAATYMTSLTGNIKNMRMPSVLSSLAAAGIEPGTPKADIISTVSVISSTIVNTAFLIILVIAGNAILKILPKPILDMIQYIVPALFGAIFAQFALMNYKSAIISVVTVAVVINIGALPTSLKAFITIILSIVINVLIYKVKENKKI